MGVPQSHQSCAPTCADLVHGDGFIEVTDDPLALEGDVKNSEAMINHKLLAAARDGDVEGIQRAIERKAYLETRRPFCLSSENVSTYTTSGLNRGTGLTPLMHASLGGYSEAIATLLKAKACANAEDEDGMSPLQLAASGNSIDVCQLLLDSGAQVDHLDDEGRGVLEHLPKTISQSERKAWQSMIGANEA
mmetsp:Transcript_55618/g.86383  ORF Transcript_55618/g.86383 Transcript_55618/m.86383 type:complete len:191 (+) Transcript_55618:40-612(+)